ncbi:MAG: hypothetical protein JRN11_05265 [Nitrososphaerota archaeon]|nr:hypothetical protein [Nitrososphaerota archaeon]MDG7026139.1 hypothetical protein [Nitrososphaerota archaeon]
MVKIKVKLGQAEAEVEADPEHLREAIDLIPDVAGKLPQMGRDQPAAADPANTARSADFPPGEQAEAPVVALEKGDSLAEVIAKFFAGPWGRERRKLSDVREALQSYGLNYPKQSVAVALLRLAKATKLRRFKAEDGEYVYTSATTVPARPLQQDGALQAADPEAAADAVQLA